MNTGHILLVDDDPVLLQALSHTISLRMSGVQVEIADSAKVALDLVQQQEYDAVVSDIKMPGMDGLDLLEQVLERYPAIPVLLITGHGEHELAIRALRRGAYDYIQKPIDRDDFVASLFRALQTRQLRRQIQVQQHVLEQYMLSLECQVEQRTREMVATRAAKDALLDMMTQELIAPLTHLKEVIHVFDSCLRQVDDIEEVRKHLVGMHQSVRRIESVILRLKATQEQESISSIVQSPANKSNEW
jgi:two-component system, sensor histidine kinase and response regulator